MRFFDTHTHLDFPAFGSPEERRFAVNRARDVGICEILIPAFSPLTWRQTRTTVDDLARFCTDVCIHTALGIHPWAIADLTQHDLSANFAQLREWLGDPPDNLVALGECGLDFGRRGKHVPRARQVEVLLRHFELARLTGFPLILHCVKAHGVLLDLLRSRPLPPSIVHSFSGSPEVATLLCRLGHYISFASAVTLPSAKRPKAAARAIPLDRLLVETDSPDQLPYARRTDAPRPSEPAFVVEIAQAIAHLRGIDLREVADATLANARRVLRVGGVRGQSERGDRGTSEPRGDTDPRKIRYKNC